MSDPAGPVQFSLGDLGGPFGKFSDHSERWTKRTTKTAWSSPEAGAVKLNVLFNLVKILSNQKRRAKHSTA